MGYSGTMLRTYDVYIETDRQLKGTRIHTIVHGRSGDEVMDQVLLIHGLSYQIVEKIRAVPRA